jgi:hypothetical protein
MFPSSSPTTDSGAGLWFKIFYLGPSSNTTWATDCAAQINLTIPLTTPSGAHLLRLELPYSIKGWPAHSQWYANCTHVEIVRRGEERLGL